MIMMYDDLSSTSDKVKSLLHQGVTVCKQVNHLGM